jgi:flagellar motor switch protein FliM
LREERRLRVIENRVLRKIFRPTRSEVSGVWKRIHKEELCDF